VDEAYAWLQQALSDRAAAERLSGDENGVQWCHAIAKYQQTVEKAVKAIVVALHISVGYQHGVGHFVDVLIRLPRRPGNRDIANNLSRWLDTNTRTAIRSLDILAPRRPAPGQPHQRNTEYPFQDPHDRWTYPAARGVFSSAEIKQFRDLPHRIARVAEQVISAIRRAPR
jgi:HEPN domain-containing protein